MTARKSPAKYGNDAKTDLTLSIVYRLKNASFHSCIKKWKEVFGDNGTKAFRFPVVAAALQGDFALLEGNCSGPLMLWTAF